MKPSAEKDNGLCTCCDDLTGTYWAVCILCQDLTATYWTVHAVTGLTIKIIKKAHLYKSQCKSTICPSPYHKGI
jgi:hypothetical protein